MQILFNEKRPGGDITTSPRPFPGDSRIRRRRRSLRSGFGNNSRLFEMVAVAEEVAACSGVIFPWLHVELLRRGREGGWGKP